MESTGNYGDLAGWVKLINFGKKQKNSGQKRTAGEF